MKAQLEEPRTIATAPAPKTPTSPKPPSHSGWDDDEEETSGFKKWRVPVIAMLVLAGGIGFFANAMSKKSAAPPPKQEVTVVHLIAPPQTPPPPPPPPPPQAEEKKQDIIEEVKQDDAPPEPAPQVETALKGGGNTGMVLKSGNGSGVFANRNNVSAERMRWSAYAGQVKSRISQALESNPRTRKARIQLDIRVWPDATGRITRAKLDTTTGDAALDALIRDEILTGLQISEPPPAGMPSAILMRINARRPN